MLLNDAMADRQAQAGSFYCGLSCIEGLKDQIDVVRRNAYTCILNRHGYTLLFLPGAYRDHSAALEAGVCCVGLQIKKDLLDLVRNRRDRRQPFSIVQYYGNSFVLEIALAQQQQGVDGLMYIHHYLLAR